MEELDVAGLSWTSWNMIQSLGRADQGHLSATDATRTGFTRQGMEHPQVSGHTGEHDPACPSACTRPGFLVHGLPTLPAG